MVLENGSDLFLSYAAEQREAACLEAKGAVGVIRLQKSMSVPGCVFFFAVLAFTQAATRMFFNLYHGGMDTAVHVHVLAALQNDFSAVSTAILRGENVKFEIKK